MPLVPEPRIERSLTLHFKGDWGMANIHRLLGWLCSGAVERCGAHSRVAIWNGTGGIDGVVAVGRGEADLAIATPSAFIAAAPPGRAPFAERHDLRALAVIPQRDAMVFALPASYGIASFAELHARQPPLRIAVAPDDGINLIGLGGQRHLEALGLDRATIRSWGGDYVEILQPAACLAAVTSGRADAVMQEAIMGPWWREAVAARDLRLLATPDAVLNLLQERYGWGRYTIPAGHFSNQAAAVTTLDFSDFLVFVRADMAEDLAHLLTWCLVETRALIEAQYRHIKPEWSPISYPLEPARMAQAPIALHPGAQRYYEAACVL